MWQFFTKSQPVVDPPKAKEEKIVLPRLYIRLWKVEDRRHPALDPRANDRIGPMHVTSVESFPGGRIWYYNLDDTDKTKAIRQCSLPEWQAWASNYLTENPDTAVYVFEKWDKE